jgi:hypothetical protein
VLVDAATTLVHKVACVGLEQVGNHLALAAGTGRATFTALLLVCGTATRGIFLEVKVTKEVMWVEVVPFNAIWCRDLATVIDFVLVEHLLLAVSLDDVAVGISEVPALVRCLTIIINSVALRICENNNVALFIAIEVSEDIVLVEVSGIVVWRHLDCWVTVLELYKRLLRHFKCFLLWRESLITDCRLNIEVEVFGGWSWLVLRCLLGRIEVGCLLTFSFST